MITNSALRTRWAAVGAAVAITIGAVGIGGMNMVSADVSTGDRPVFIPITPCRLLDTRPAPNNVGSRSTPLGATEQITATAHGSNGQCTGSSAIPTDAVGLSLNVTALNATVLSFLTFWGDGTRPLAANLNPSPGQPPLPNAVNTPLSATGTFNVYNSIGTVDVVIDINGYYANHNHDEKYSQLGHLHDDKYSQLGHLHDDRYLRTPDKIVISPAEFDPVNENIMFKRLGTISTPGAGCVDAPVDVPNGKTIASITAAVSVVNAGDSANIVLRRHQYAAGLNAGVAAGANVAVQNGAPITTAGVVTNVTAAVPPAVAVVDNSQYIYTARVCFIASNAELFAVTLALT